MDEYPAFDQLPVAPGLPPASAWGVFGDDDEIGTLNFIGPHQVAAAAQLVRQGVTIPLNWRMDLPQPSVFGRGSPQHHVLFGDTSIDEYYDSFYTQGSSQWDALCHMRNPVHGHYNGVPETETVASGGQRLGIHHWAQRGIAGRFVLLDVAGHRARVGNPIDHTVRTSVGVRELDRIMAAQGVEHQRGDIVLLHFGWTAWYLTLDQEARTAYVTEAAFTSAGLAPGRETTRWLWNHRVAAVAADNPSVEATPFDTTSSWSMLHWEAIPLLGLALGELFDLRALAAHCAETGLYEGMFVAAPLNSPGGSGSPANAVALL